MRWLHLSVALLVACGQTLIPSHQAFEPDRADCCRPDGKPRIDCGDDCDRPAHHHHRPHARCAACTPLAQACPPAAWTAPAPASAIAHPIRTLELPHRASPRAAHAARAPPALPA
jgi:hypothetical protein